MLRSLLRATECQRPGPRPAFRQGTRQRSSGTAAWGAAVTTVQSDAFDPFRTRAFSVLAIFDAASPIVVLAHNLAGMAPGRTSRLSEERLCSIARPRGDGRSRRTSDRSRARGLSGGLDRRGGRLGLRPNIRGKKPRVPLGPCRGSCGAAASSKVARKRADRGEDGKWN